MPWVRRTLTKGDLGISQKEVARPINASSRLFQRALPMVLYGTGLRRSELARVKIAHIDRQRMIIHVVDGEGHNDWDLPLSPTLLRPDTRPSTGWRPASLSALNLP
jgi:integrase